MLADFITERSFCTQPIEPQTKKPTPKQSPIEGSSNNQTEPKPKFPDCWFVYLDRLSTLEGGRARILLIGPNKEEFKYSIRFKFPVTNNVTYYKTLLLGLQLAKKILARKIVVHIDL